MPIGFRCHRKKFKAASFVVTLMGCFSDLSNSIAVGLIG